MEEQSTESVLKFLKGEISFTEWLEKKKDEIVIAEEEQDKDSDVEDENEPKESTPASSQKSWGSQVPTLDNVRLESQRILSNAGSLASTGDTQPSVATPITVAMAPPRMTDLLLMGSGVTDVTKRPAARSVDEFRSEIPSLKKKPKTRRRQNQLPKKFEHQMGQANLCCAHGEYEKAKNICMEIIRQVPKCPEPFHTLGLMYEESGDKEKALQFFLIAAHLNKPGDVEEWIKLAAMSLEMDDLKQAFICYNQALKLEPENLSVLWERAALCYQMKDIKKALESYQTLLRAVPPEEGEKYFDLATEVAGIYHENESTAKAIEVLQEAFEKHPTFVTLEAVNMIAELHMVTKTYAAALEVLCTHCQIKREVVLEEQRLSPIADLVKASFGEDNSLEISCISGRRESEKWIIPSDVMIDLRVKTVICLIHLQRRTNIMELIEPLFREDAEVVGDLYLDVADAFTENSRFEEALPFLDVLVVTSKYNLAGVWLKKAECARSLGRLEEAVTSYTRVVSLAPNHLDARLALASLHQQLGRPDDALDVLTADVEQQDFHTTQQDATSDVTLQPTDSGEEPGSESVSQPLPQDVRLLFHKCALLHSQGRKEEFVNIGREMMDWYFIDVTAFPDLYDIALTQSRRTQVQKLKGNEKSEESSDIQHSKREDDTGIRIEEWWDMFKKVLFDMGQLKHFSEAERLILCALSSRRFANVLAYRTEMELMAVLALNLNNKHKQSFDFLKVMISKTPEHPVLWSMLARIVVKTQDSRHHRYCLRLLLKYPDSLPLVIMNGHNAFLSGSYKYAIGEYTRAFRQTPENPLLSLCLGIQFLHLACQKYPRGRHACIIQGITFLFQYLGLRGHNQEAFYNIGRAFHQLGLSHLAIHYYHKALEFPLYEAKIGKNQAKFTDKRDLHREAAFNLSLIYRSSGNIHVARDLLLKYCRL